VLVATNRLLSSTFRPVARSASGTESNHCLTTETHQPTARTKKTCKCRPFLKRLMGFEPTTFCMASRTCIADSTTKSPAKYRVYRQSASTTIPGVYRKITGIWAPNGHRRCLLPLAGDHRAVCGSTRRSRSRDPRRWGCAAASARPLLDGAPQPRVGECAGNRRQPERKGGVAQDRDDREPARHLEGEQGGDHAALHAADPARQRQQVGKPAAGGRADLIGAETDRPLRACWARGDRPRARRVRTSRPSLRRGRRPRLQEPHRGGAHRPPFPGVGQLESGPGRGVA
jgi:hypothetical protein